MDKFCIAKDKNGSVYLFKNGVHLSSFGDQYVPENTGSVFEISRDLFPDLKFEDGPVEVTLNLVK